MQAAITHNTNLTNINITKFIFLCIFFPVSKNVGKVLSQKKKDFKKALKMYQDLSG